jgi:regulator of sirC expression with transglutaminase-like and TPR domain
MKNPSEINALVQLIDDPDELIFVQVKDKLLEMGSAVVPHLEKAWVKNNFGELFQFRLETIIHDIQLKDVFQKLGNWILKPENLLEGVLIVNKYKYPNINLLYIENLITQLVSDIKSQINDNQTALEKIQVINKILFDIYGFRGDKTNYHDPENSYFNAVLTKKKGNPLMLSILYIEIAKRMQIPIYGINLPNHFLVGFLEEDYQQNNYLYNRDSHGILFYINPFSKGTILYQDEIDDFLVELKLEQHPKYYSPCNNISIIRRILTNLIYSYTKLNEKKNVAELKKIIQLFN